MKFMHSKNTNTGAVNTGGGDFRLGDNFYKSAEYADFLKSISRLEKLVKYAETDQERLDFSKELSQEQSNLESFRKDIIQLAQTFEKIEIDTEPLKQSKLHFEKGEFKEARAVLNAEKMSLELDALLAQKGNLTQKAAQNENALIHKANEFLILAYLTFINFSLPDRFEQACKYFDLSLTAVRHEENLSLYASFLQENNQFLAAEKLFEEALIKYEQKGLTNDNALENSGAVLNRLGISYIQTHKFKLAKAKFKKALKIYHDLSDKTLEQYKEQLADTLNNLGGLYQQRNKLSKAEKYYSDSLDIKRILYRQNPEKYSLDLAIAISNLALVYSMAKEKELAKPCFEEALKIYYSFSQLNPMDLNRLVLFLNNYGEFYEWQKLYNEALPLLQKALDICRTLVISIPYVILPSMGMVLNNLANVTAKTGNLPKAQSLLEEALQNYDFLSRHEPGGYSSNIAKASINLASIYGKNGRTEEAIEFFQTALQINQSLSKNNSKIYLGHLASILFGLAWTHSNLGKFQESKDYYEKSLEIFERLANKEPHIYDIDVVTVATNMSRFHVITPFKDQERSLFFARKALYKGILLHHNGYIAASEYLRITTGIIAHWGVEVEAFYNDVVKELNYVYHNHKE